MCGIAGILQLDGEPVSPVVLRRMTDIIAHRGPDGEGHFVDGMVGLGHRRLAIIDLTPAGHQPMATPDGSLVLTYNGEMYNFQELRVELEALGYTFRSRTDSEVVLYALHRWGWEAVRRFNGMFAFAAWDARKQELLLARDRYGIKPLYYGRAGGAVLFGSEFKAFLTHPDFSAAMDCEALVEYLTFQNFFTDRTLLRGVRLLPAATVLRIPAQQGANELPAPVRYWDFSFHEPEMEVDENEYVEELDRLFRRAVLRQLVSDVPVGAYLSGGLDSGSITAIASRHLPEMRTFTVGFDLQSVSGVELNWDERPAAEHLSYVCGTEHYEMVLKAGDMERVMPQLAWHIEEPRVGQSYPNYYAAKLASRFGKVVLAGTGGDELFGGYPWRYYRAVSNADFEDYIDKYYVFWQRLVANRQLQALVRPIREHTDRVWTRDIFRDIYGRRSDVLSRPEDYINHSMYLEARTFLHGLLVVEDKLSMAHGLETRVPFLDNDLVDFAMALPVDLKLRNLGEVVRINENEAGHKTARYMQRNSGDGKVLLRRVMERHVPPAVVEREKQGFAAPDASWFRGDSIDYVRRALMGRNARIYEFLDADVARSLINEHLEGRENRRLLIWSLLSLESFCGAFLDGERPWTRR
jgi:asparagine synthase (glutamine-hydrolysing)